jgi:hypothetical protein
MTKRTSARGLAALALLVVGWAQVAPEATAKEQTRPFRGRAQGTITGTIDPGPDSPFGGLTASWAGKATHLGRFTREERLYFTNEEGTQFEGTMVFRAANGDELVVEFSGEFDPGPVDGVLLAVGPNTMVGVTGRFADASGSARYEAFADFREGEALLGVTFNGSLRY